MASPCSRCGATKTESVYHGLIYETFWKMGYHLRRCSFCNRRRLFKRADPTHPHPDEMTVEELQERFERKIAEASGNSSAASGPVGGDMDIDSSEESRGQAAQPSRSTVSVAEAPREVEDYQLCPECGSTVYRRSHRRWYERLMKRPRMARCMKCNRRFPYPH